MRLWVEDAACREAPDPRIFDPVPEPRGKDNKVVNPYDKTKVRKALTYCRRCPVITECELDALSEIKYPASGTRAGRYIDQAEAKKNLDAARIAAGYEPSANQHTFRNRVARRNEYDRDGDGRIRKPRAHAVGE